MSLFPAYGTEDAELILPGDSLSTVVKYDVSHNIQEFTETELLASDEEQGGSSTEKKEQMACVRERSPLRDSNDFYLDTKLDPGNLWVSTLYYPGRPEYTPRSIHVERKKSRRARRYFERPPAAADDAAQAAARAAAFRRALADQPLDLDLWMQFIDFQERCSGGPAACRAATEACSALPRSAALRELRLDLARRYLPPEQHLTELRDLLAKEPPGPGKLSLWARLLTALAHAPGGALPALTAAARAALDDCRAPAAYPRLLYVYGSFLRSAGLWEQLVLLLELALGLSLPPAPGFPPPAPPADCEEALLAAEERAVSSGLPLGAVWARVERLRAAAHWRADAAGAARSADPQRAPAAAELAALLRPLAGRDALLLLVQALRLVKVPLLPASEWVVRAADGACARALAGAGWACDCGSALLPLLRAARRLPPAHRARASDARALAACLQPPNYLQHSELLAWVEALWEAALRWAAGAPRAALLGWRLRWLHALALLAREEAERRRLRARARDALRRHAGGAALPFLQFARLERALAGPAAARRVALAALRRDQNATSVVRLYGARVLRELCEPGSAVASWALCCAATGRPLPDDDVLDTPPPADLCELAAKQCEERCAEIENSFSCGPEEEAEVESVCAALLPSEAEWASARAALAAPARRAALLRALLAARAPDAGARALRWREQAACALALAAAADAKAVDTARQLAPLFPHNAFLNLGAAGGALSSGGAARTDTAALARALPALLAAPPAALAPAEAERVHRSLSRAAAGGAGGALLALARLEAAARRARPDPARDLYIALDAAPHSKALHVAGAAWGADARALADALLARQLRLHALPDELRPLTPPPPAISDQTQ